MKLAVIGDIHSNHIALETCIEHALARNVDEFLFWEITSVIALIRRER